MKVWKLSPDLWGRYDSVTMKFVEMNSKVDLPMMSCIIRDDKRWRKTYEKACLQL